MYLIKTPWLLKKLYPQLIWNMNRERRVIYLTFDDGPIPVVTPFVLETLKKYNAKATFFCIGDNISKHPDIYQQLIADGHAIGNHTYNHLKGWETDDNTYVQNFQKASDLMLTSLFRPPYGRIKRSQIRQLKALQPDLRIIMWDVLSGDFDTTLKPANCLKGVLKYTSNGAIVVFHDSLKAFERLEYVLPRALEEWAKAGFEFAIL
ncbi:polysaccharide deacetylase family protein [Mucilaginibacter daejeonensis]|uniref:polysaccharide deacetylase family protein n=1 Tax=Mucilaginibacter daejeonensis TaxID=398049 RepID=UPI001D174B3F|nr:polysaccharide deacetylase family protein [Mucilaginibacter daejeonensis]UEG53994.1 polysaccharide deacetylase family protein [Mucilaginibacter daejeonensis]